MKVKVIDSADYGTEGLEEEVNEFIKGKKIIDIKLTSYYVPDEWAHYNALIMYE